MGITRKVDSLHGMIEAQRNEQAPPLLVCAVKGDLGKDASDGVMTQNVNMVQYVDVSLIPNRVRDQVVRRAKMKAKQMMESGKGLDPITKAELDASRPPMPTIPN